jgi:hypothetical protein
MVIDAVLVLSSENKRSTVRSFLSWLTLLGRQTDRLDTAREAAGLDAVMTGISIVARDDHGTTEKAGPVYDALHTFYRLRLMREEHKTEIEKMDRVGRREFLRRKLMD